MPIDPFLRARAADLRDASLLDLLDPQKAPLFAAFSRDPAPWRAPAVPWRDLRVPGPHGKVDVRVYGGENPNAPLFVWAHGGAFIYGDLEMSEAHMVSSELAFRGSATIVSVGYRLATGGVRYPVPADDVFAAWAWAREEFSSAGRRTLGGASAGSALALSAALRARAEHATPDALLLIYPFVHFPVPALDQTTVREMAQLPPFLRFFAEDIRRMVRDYVGRIDDIPPMALPGNVDLTGLCRTLVILAEYDDLRPSGELLIEQLASKGVPVDRYLAGGVFHGYLNRTPGLQEVGRTLDRMVQAVTGRD